MTFTPPTRWFEQFLPGSPRTLASWFELALRVLMLVIGARVFVMVATSTLVRLDYPYEIEWMEGAMVDHVVRVLDGRPLYVAPSAEFVPYIYPPLFYWVSAGVASVLGVGLPALRAVAIGALALSLGILFDFVRRETHCWWAAVVSLVLFAATFTATEMWFGLARVDTLMLMLVLAACWLVRFRVGMPSAVLAGVLLAAACFAKQQAFLLAAAPIAYTLLSDRRRFLAVTLAALVVGSTVAIVLDVKTDGWFWFYVFEAPRQHAWRWPEWHTFLLNHFWNTTGIHGVLAVAALAVPVTTGRGWAKSSLYVGLWLTASVSGYISMLHTDGWVNVLIPAYAVYSLLAGLLIGWLASRSDERVRSRSLIVCHLAVLVALGLLDLDHGRARPKRDDELAVRDAITRLASMPGPVFSPGTGHYAYLAGHRESSAHNMAIRDVLKTENEEAKKMMMDDIEEKLKNHHWPTVLLGRSQHVVPVRSIVRRYYVRDGTLFEGDRGRCRSGMAVRPEEIWVPRPPRSRSRSRPKRGQE